MNMKEIKELLQMMAEHDLSELEIDKEGLKVKFKKGGDFQANFALPSVPTRIYSSAEVKGSDTPAAPATPAVVSDALPANVVIVKSPMVGTFYAAPAPDQAPYVAPGTKIKEGDVLCIVEAMKLMNEIKSELQGEVLEILVKNGQPVEFDQPLFKVKKA